ncbi:MAG: hypothetical protein ACD_78C00156G0008 [uncultured bacterium (gcode 4)]|uniref:Uncharacterized protein n=1 Tax=uncultured bacterium (gcode 4) TaxID=1234023 RepID=K1XY93_9BACT|nr:MAG: hypothetical protein ACD_78C00156G0008 [uncultured bacterium (gcode 4)]HBB27249.1 hypothetical protein [Candidatus Gracilibacteria bacterium]
MPKPIKKEDAILTIKEAEVLSEAVDTVEEKPKAIPPKPPISRSGPAFPPVHQFRGSQAGAMNNRQRPGRAANRGR